MDVTLIAHTNVSNILEYVGQIASTCYNSTPASYAALAKACRKSGHMSVFEHMSFTWSVKGVSRACSHQLVRHRLASYTQESQRYVKVDTDNEWYVIPDECNTAVARVSFKYEMERCGEAYNDMLKNGVKAEVARAVLPNATKTNLVITMNLREFMHFLDLRLHPRAQKEIRTLAKQMLVSVNEAYPGFIDFYQNQ